MRNVGRSILVALLAVVGVATVVVASTVQAFTSAVSLTATALYLGGTDAPTERAG